MYNNTYVESGPEGLESILNGAGVVAIIFILLIALIALAAVILVLISNCKIFKKAGETWWKGLIPLYNSWIETKITGLAWWWFLIYTAGVTIMSFESKTVSPVISMAIVLISFNYNYNLAKKFGKSNGFAVFNTILPFIGLPILAFGSAKYDKDAKVDENGIFSIKKW